MPTSTPSSVTLPTRKNHLKPRRAFIISPKPPSTFSDAKCPICWESYSSPPPRGSELPPGQDFAVSLDMVATPDGLRRSYGHVIGRQCLEKHLTTRGPWRNKCPLCRDEWYADSSRSNASQLPGLPPTELHERSHSINGVQRSERIAARLSRTTLEPRMSVRHGVNRESRRQRTRRRMAHFIPRLFEALGVSEEDLEVDGLVEDVEKKLREMYKSLKA